MRQGRVARRREHGKAGLADRLQGVAVVAVPWRREYPSDFHPAAQARPQLNALPSLMSTSCCCIGPFGPELVIFPSSRGPAFHGASRADSNSISAGVLAVAEGQQEVRGLRRKSLRNDLIADRQAAIGEPPHEILQGRRQRPYIVVAQEYPRRHAGGWRPSQRGPQSRRSAAPCGSMLLTSNSTEPGLPSARIFSAPISANWLCATESTMAS